MFTDFDAFIGRLERDYSNPKVSLRPHAKLRKRDAVRRGGFGPLSVEEKPVEDVLRIVPKGTGANWQMHLNLPLWVKTLRNAVTLYNLRGEWLSSDLTELNFWRPADMESV